MLPIQIFGPKASVSTYAVLDEASTVTLIDYKLARDVGLKGRELKLTLAWIDPRETVTILCEKTKFKIKGSFAKHNVENAITKQDLCLPSQSIPLGLTQRIMSTENIKIKHYSNARPQLLIGQDNWPLIITREFRELNNLCLSRTLLGWTVHGFLPEESEWNANLFVQTYDMSGDEKLNYEGSENLTELIKQYFLIDNFGSNEVDYKNERHKHAEIILETTCKRVDRGWEVGLLWSKNLPFNVDSRPTAQKRLTLLERRLDKDPKYATLYYQEMQRFINSGYARKVTDTSRSGRECYLPHFGVGNINKPNKVRIVFDAAAETGGISLNHQLDLGPDLLETLPGVLLRFRQYAIAVKSDIKDMFLRIKVRHEDRAAQRFLWRGADRVSEPEMYEMTSLIFGAKSSPSSAIYVKNKNALEFSKSDPEASTSIVRNSYMDDYLMSANSIETATKIARAVIKINDSANFPMYGWSSNSEQVLGNIAENGPISGLRENRLIDSGKERVLGLLWDTTSDSLKFNVDLNKIPREIADGSKRPTKREVLQVLMSIFDPLGFLAPIVIKARILMQEVILSGVQWDEKIREEEYLGWCSWLDELDTICEWRIPRCLTPIEGQNKDAQLHVYCDASLKAYAAAAYLRFASKSLTAHTMLVAAKCKVAPLKPMTVPRLELQAALLGVKLAKSLVGELDISISRRTFWTDSITVLRWIQTEPRTKQIFVANRLGQINELSQGHEWRWVPSALNPADDATRGSDSPHQSDARWLYGPQFLKESEKCWPRSTALADDRKREIDSLELRKCITLATTTSAPPKFSLWLRCLGWQGLLIIARRVLAAVDRWNKRPKAPVTVDRLEEAEKFWFLVIQYESFNQEVEAIRKNLKLPRSSKIKKLMPFIDDSGFLRANGRVTKVLDYAFNNNPIILDGDHPATRMLIKQYHQRYFHGSSNTVMNEIRQKFYITRLRRNLEMIIGKCITCRVQRGKPQCPIMSSLPSARLAYREHPFSRCGIDYFVPLLVKVGRRREKRWGVLFTCLTVRAVHLELAHSLSLSSAIMAFQRLSARRGVPKALYSDNGTNFRGANRELREAADVMDQDKLRSYALTNRIDWHFNPPEAPHMGGAWERLIRSVKSALHIVLREQAPSEEVLITVFAEIEHAINSRPLTHVPVDPRDDEALTPNHFLLGSSTGHVPLGNCEGEIMNTRKQWKLAQTLSNAAWKRWLHEYLPTLIERPKWVDKSEQLKVGDIVLIIDFQVARNEWRKGTITQVYPGADGVIRVAKIHSQRRPCETSA